MAYAPVSNIIFNYDEYPNQWIKFYKPNTTTPIAMATDVTGATTLAKAQLNNDGFPTTDGTALFIPFLNQSYDCYLFPTEAEADANDTINALRIAESINPFNDDFSITKTVLTVVEGQTLYPLPFNVGTESVVIVNGRVQSEGAGAYLIDSNGDLVLSEGLFDGDILEVWNRGLAVSPGNEGSKENPYTFNSLRELLNADLTNNTFAIGGWIETLGRVQKNDGGGATYQVAASGTVDFETVIPLKLGLVGELVNGPRIRRHNGPVEIAAHRGFTDFNVEQTMYAFTSALQYGADSLECDIQITSDGVPILFHDKDTTETLLNNITGKIKDNTFAQTQLATWKEFAGNIMENRVHLTKWTELLDYVQEAGCRVHAEIKDYRSQSDIDLMVQEVVSRNLQESVVFHSFILSDIQYVRNINKDVKIAFLTTTLDGNDPQGVPVTDGFEVLKRDKYAMAAIAITSIDNPPVFPDPIVKELHEAGVEIAAWTAQDQLDVFFARRNNVNVIITDLPLFRKQPLVRHHGTSF